MKKRNRIVKIGSALLASLCLAVPTMAGAATFDLCAGPVNVTMQDTAGTVVPMWGFALGGQTAGVCDGTLQVPGPELRTTDTSVTINLTNTLGVPVSVVIPGQVQSMTPVFDDATSISTATNRVRSFTKETAPLATVAYTWNGMKPGTFVYHSGTHSQIQVQMGLYGAVILDAAADEAYPGYPYDADAVLFFSEIDPALHDAVDTGDYGVTVTSTVTYVPKYFLINGQGYDPTSTPAAQAQTIGGPGSRTLLRFVKRGLRQRTAILQGAHVQVIAEDGNLYPFSREQYSVNLPAAKTKDALFMVPADAVATDLFPVYDRALALTNNTEWDGGMLAYLEVGGTAVTDVAITALANGTSNVPPVAEDDFASVQRRQKNKAHVWHTINLTANDSDSDGSIATGTVTILSLPAYGTIRNKGDGTVDYRPRRKKGTFNLTYTVNDNEGATSNVATLRINVTN